MRLLAPLVLLALSGCIVVNTASVAPPQGSDPDVFVTAGGISEPHESLGLVQVTRSGVLLFGFADVVGTDLESGFQRALLPEVRRLGGDGAINVRFRQTQYMPVTKVFAAIFFFIPLHSEVTLSAEVVKLRREKSPAPEPR